MLCQTNVKYQRTCPSPMSTHPKSYYSYIQTNILWDNMDIQSITRVTIISIRSI